MNSVVHCGVNIVLIIAFYPTEICLLSDNIYDYYNVSQGKITIPSMDDGEECTLTDVSGILARLRDSTEKLHDELRYPVTIPLSRTVMVK